jgi:ubiquinone/menaquinone biosynthesis C-methylase UbiE
VSQTFLSAASNFYGLPNLAPTGQATAMQSKPHSIDHFGPQRDLWWNRDFLDLMATRWHLGEANSLADIGCGRCHWSRLLYPYLRQPARLAAIDREAQWVREGEEYFRQAFPNVAPEMFNFVQGTAEKIPLPDNTFDVVTCQTVLMHLAQPLVALREMVRITRPGGIVICAEPNNLWNTMAFNSLTAAEPVETMTRRFEFWLRYQRGKVARGEGDNSIGDLLPGYFTQLGLTNVSVYMSDRAIPALSPYDAAESRTILDQERTWRESSTGPWNREELRERVLQGGGSEEFFEQVFSELGERFEQEQRAIAAGEFHTAGGGNSFLTSGRKPA